MGAGDWEVDRVEAGRDAGARGDEMGVWAARRIEGLDDVVALRVGGGSILGRVGPILWTNAVGLVLVLRVILCTCLLYTSPSPRDGLLSRMPSSA